MKMTLLDIVQDILSAQDSDLVNSINDTPEAQQVAAIVRTTYADIISEKNWPHLRKVKALNSATATRPTHCKLPDNIKELVSIRYNTASTGKSTHTLLEYVHPSKFLDMLNERDSTKDNVRQVVDVDGISLSIITDKSPTYWTSFDDEYIIMDSFNLSVESNLQSSKMQVTMYVDPVWVHTDTAIPDLPSEMFSLLKNEAKSRAFLELSQEMNEKSEMQARRQRAKLSRRDWSASNNQQQIDFGRGSRK